MKNMSDIISKIGNSYNFLNEIDIMIGSIIFVLFAYRALYYAIGLFFTRKFKPAKNNYKYAILIAARNEKNVIANLLNSIKKQDYPKELLTTFVVADNCTDNTAEIAREHGAMVYERFDQEHKTKGYALEYLLERIEDDYGRMSYDGYFIFDADNLLNQNYITKMNDAFDSGEKIITSYRNTKNFDENWISSTYALHWIRSIRMNHRARSVLRLATNIQGTGFLFASEIVRDGWHYTSLTEDRALTADAVAQGYKITYQDEAEFFDEQPVSIKVAFRQRLRWSKGHLLAFKETGLSLFLNIFWGKTFVKKDWANKTIEKSKCKGFKGILLNIVESIRHRFASFDTLVQLTPLVIINLFRWLVLTFFVYSCFCYVYGIDISNAIVSSSYLAKILFFLIKMDILIEPGVKAFFISMLLTIGLRVIYRIGLYISNMLIAVYLFIVEKKRIKKINFWKKVLYIIMWPTFDAIGRYTTYAALFAKVDWKPIPHNSNVTIDDVDTSKSKKTN